MTSRAWAAITTILLNSNEESAKSQGRRKRMWKLVEIGCSHPIMWRRITAVATSDILLMWKDHTDLIQHTVRFTYSHPFFKDYNFIYKQLRVNDTTAERLITNELLVQLLPGGIIITSLIDIDSSDDTAHLIACSNVVLWSSHYTTSLFHAVEVTDAIKSLYIQATSFYMWYTGNRINYMFYKEKLQPFGIVVVYMKILTFLGLTPL